MRIPLLLAALCLAAGSARAQDAAQDADAERQALAYEVQECVTAKVRTTTQLFVLKARLDAMTRRAEEAEARLKAAGKPPE